MNWHHGDQWRNKTIISNQQDRAPSPEAPSPPEVTSGPVFLDEPLHGRHGTPFQAHLPSASRGANLIVDSHLFAAETGSPNATAAAAGGGAHGHYQSVRGHSSGSADRGGGSGGGDGHTRRPRSAGYAGTTRDGEIFDTEEAFAHVRDEALHEEKLDTGGSQKGQRGGTLCEGIFFTYNNGSIGHPGTRLHTSV